MRSLIAITIVFGLEAALAQASITTTVTPTGKVHLCGLIVDVYTISQDAGPGRTIGAVLMGFGNDDDPNQLGTDHDDDPFQAWRWALGHSVLYKSETMANQSWIADPNYDPNARYADSHFTDPNNWTLYVPTVVAPTEVNDANYQAQGAGFDGLNLGLGELYAQASIPLAVRTQAMVIAQVGVVRGTEVWGWTNSADDLGNPVDYEFQIIPEPGTLSLIGLCALAVLRRRRSHAG